MIFRQSAARSGLCRGVEPQTHGRVAANCGWIRPGFRESRKRRSNSRARDQARGHILDSAGLSCAVTESRLQGHRSAPAEQEKAGFPQKTACAFLPQRGTGLSLGGGRSVLPVAVEAGSWKLASDEAVHRVPDKAGRLTKLVRAEVSSRGQKTPGEAVSAWNPVPCRVLKCRQA